ncbi:MAG: CBS domain-containing protein [Desulfovibrionaceae bacterium]|nr:CBS domain-containing protein [Desulfovibrionaceae bacterium]
MLMRKRAWDIVREDYVRVERESSLVEVMRRLMDCLKSGDGCLCALVFEGANLLGAVSIWEAIRFMHATLRQAGLTREADEIDFEDLFRGACQVGADTKVTEIMDTAYTELSPDLPIPLIMEKFIKKGRDCAVVKEGTKVLGVIMIQDIFVELTESVRIRV